jgi:hypothetical protein
MKPAILTNAESLVRKAQAHVTIANKALLLAKFRAAHATWHADVILWRAEMKIWRDGHGKEYRYSELSNDHLIHILQMLKARDKHHPAYVELREEARSRGLLREMLMRS